MHECSVTFKITCLFTVMIIFVLMSWTNFNRQHLDCISCFAQHFLWVHSSSSQTFCHLSIPGDHISKLIYNGSHGIIREKPQFWPCRISCSCSLPAGQNKNLNISYFLWYNGILSLPEWDGGRKFHKVMIINAKEDHRFCTNCVLNKFVWLQTSSL